MPTFQKPIALSPASGGGRCIDQSALASADIIVSTTRAAVSTAIRVETSSVVSHAALYAGKGNVIEAIGQGVVRHGLMIALADDVLAVAYRSPGMNAAMASAIIQYAQSKVGLHYTRVGAALSINPIMCRLAGPRPASFFCSQLVLEAYQRGGLPLSPVPSQCITPGDVVHIAQHQLTYVGHLKGDPAWFPIVAP